MNHGATSGVAGALFDMAVGEMRVLETEQGCHLVRLTERVTPPLPPLAAVEERLRALLRREQEIRLLRALVEDSARHVTVERRAVSLE